jgi:hypothetical protein
VRGVAHPHQEIRVSIIPILIKEAQNLRVSLKGKANLIFQTIIAQMNRNYADHRKVIQESYLVSKTLLWKTVALNRYSQFILSTTLQLPKV